ncbi:hypothetical protein CVV65_10255 [Kyrpidia spormannii]|uniref:Uncharacterized protein n=1 Tax=Kyrpidia spormannii TaxID=2055160 RepID=A0A2K8NA00_9BACL|nr:hypothetical protein [Kyrpidia spormannii]ATY85262.1 hypothetical protein CVV65_10255 [Kyrpidia spormannii]
MLWLAILFVAAALLEWPAMWRAGQRRELTVHGTLLALALVMAAMVQWQVYLQFNPLAPLEAVFGPITQWFYRIL